jgi:hypothetical protein
MPCLVMAVGTLSGLVAQVDPGWLIRVHTSDRTYAVREDGTFVRDLRHLDTGRDPSPRSDWVLEKQPQGAEFALFVTDRSGETRRALTGVPVSEARWAPDGRHVLFVSAHAGPPQAWSADATSGEQVRLTDDEEGVRQPQLATDGTLAYAAFRWKKATEEYRALSLDERLARKGTLDRVDLVVRRPSGETHVVAGGAIVHAYALRPDGRAVAYATIGRVIVVKPGAGSLREIPFADLDPRLTTSHVIRSIAWRPDAAALLACTEFVGGRAAGASHPIFGDGDCFVLTLDGNRPRRFWVSPSAELDWLQGEGP